MLGHRPLVPEDYLAIVKRRWWLILLPLVILPIITYAFSYTIPPRYMSQTLVLVEGQKVPDNYVKPVLSSDLDSRLASMKEQILSRSRLQPIIERYNLYGNGHLDMDDRIDLVRKDIEIDPIHSAIARSGGLPGFFITFKADDPRTAQLVCGEILSLFSTENERLRADTVEGTTDFLKGQLDDAKRNLDEQDAKLAAFQRQYLGRLPGQETANSDMLSSLNTQLQAVTQQLESAEQGRSYLQAMLAQQSQASVPINSNLPVLPPPTNPVQQELQSELQGLLTQQAELSSHYTDDYPDVVAVKRKIADVRKQIAQANSPVASSPGSPAVSRESPAVQQLRAQLRAADMGIEDKKRQQASLQASIGNYQSRIESSPMVEEQYKQLTRDYQTTQATYDDLLTKMGQSKMATDLEKRQEGEQFRILDPANLPDAPFSPKRTLFLGSGAAFGLVLGLSLAALFEYKDTTLRSERDIWAFTQLPTLGVLAYSESLLETGYLAVGAKKKKLFSFSRKPKQIAGAES